MRLLANRSGFEQRSLREPVGESASWCLDLLDAAAYNRVEGGSLPLRINFCYNKDMKNTLQKGSVRYIVFKEEDTWYAVALEFNIVESGDDPREVLMLLFEAVEGYVRSARKYKARPAVLNQKTDEEYEQLWKTLQKEKEGTKTRKRMPIVATFGRQSLAAA